MRSTWTKSIQIHLSGLYKPSIFSGTNQIILTHTLIAHEVISMVITCLNMWKNHHAHHAEVFLAASVASPIFGSPSPSWASRPSKFQTFAQASFEEVATSEGCGWLQTPWKNDEITRFSENKWRKHDKQYDKTLVVCENPKFPKHENSSAKSAKKTCRMFVFSGQQYFLESD